MRNVKVNWNIYSMRNVKVNWNSNIWDAYLDMLNAEHLSMPHDTPPKHKKCKTIYIRNTPNIQQFCRIYYNMLHERPNMHLIMCDILDLFEYILVHLGVSYGI